MVFITHKWEKNSHMINTGFLVSIGETGRQQEKNIKRWICVKSKSSDNRYL